MTKLVYIGITRCSQTTQSQLVEVETNGHSIYRRDPVDIGMDPQIASPLKAGRTLMKIRV
ncbi:hypothetical protein CBM2637_B100073 [Cupriavidus taiwanensis]|nr:hypothetical protein CBM2637_B100073 [Cupriavidus taiwanensis]